MPNPQTAAEKWVRTVPLDCPHPEAREVYICYECAAANLDAYAREQIAAAVHEVLEEAEKATRCERCHNIITALREGRDAKIS